MKQSYLTPTFRLIYATEDVITQSVIRETDANGNVEFVGWDNFN